ncbi:hypothetical protein [Sulfuracidifex metallicus]|uniref:hypothetical protein n=1 Tax=Sulfuracidifex metallicus TaxID=47303 RepID=UPI002274D512|nr:hypothetical protein [Sulfuracidifex metallicus]MCY0849451.1 hypothetical protein [Sulfuracidifex metallicus]
MKTKVADLPLLGDRYTMKTDKDGLKLINSSGESVNLSLLDLGNEISDEITKNKGIYYKLIPLSMYPDIITFKLIDTVIKIGGLADDLLEASCKKGETYCKYALSKIKEENLPLFKLSTDTLDKIKKIDKSSLFLYEDVRGLYTVDKEIAFEKITSKKILSLEDLYILREMGKIKYILKRSVVHVDSNFPADFIILLSSLTTKRKELLGVIKELTPLKVSECSFRTPEMTDFLRIYSAEFDKFLNKNNILFISDINTAITRNGTKINIDLTEFFKENKITVMKQSA